MTIKTLKKLEPFIDLTLGQDKKVSIKKAEDILEHNFIILSKKISFGPKINWHTNFLEKSWPVKDYRYLNQSVLVYNSPDYIGDVKLPWELSKHLHFQDLAKAYLFTGDERYTREFIVQLKDWITDNPFEQGVNWAHGLVVGQRAISWVLAVLVFKDSKEIDSSFLKAFLKSLEEHAKYLDENYEICARSTNHLLGELCASIVINTVFKELSGADLRLERAKTMLETELEKQVYFDGVDYEQSVSYQRYILQFLSLIILLEKKTEKTILCLNSKAKIDKMFRFLASMVQPNGLLQPISDADGARVISFQQDINDPSLLFKLANIDVREAQTASAAFPEGGYWISRGKGSWLFFDCGYMGMGKWPKDLPLGVHGHSDTLNFGLAISDETFLTDNGSYSYTTERPFHQYFRSSMAHNVTVLEGKDQNIILDSPWLAKQQALPQNPRHYFTGDIDYLSGEHTGYQRFGLTFKRELMHFKNEEFLILKDSFIGKAKKHHVSSLFHLAPDLKVKAVQGGYRILGKKASLEIQAFTRMKKTTFSGQHNPVKGWYAPNYGQKVPATELEFRYPVKAPEEVYFLLAWGKKKPGQDLARLFENKLAKIRKPKVVMMVTNDISADPRVQKEASALSRLGFDVDTLGFSGPSAARKFFAEDYKVHQLAYEPFTPLKFIRNFLGRKIMSIYFRIKVIPVIFGRFSSLKGFFRKGTLNLIDNEINQRVSEPNLRQFKPNILTPFHYFYDLNRQLSQTGESLAPDIVHAHDLDTLLAGYLVKRKTGAKLVYDSHELWTKQGMPIPKVLVWLMGQLEKWLLKRTDAVISVNESIISELEAMYNLKLGAKKLVVYNCPIKVKVKPIKQAKKGFSVLYQGRFAPGRGLEELVLASRFFRDNITLYFRCTGEKAVKEKISQLIKKFRLEKRIKILEPVSMSEMVQAGAFADIGVIPYLPVNKNNEFASPNKLFEYMMSGLALATSDLPELRRFVIECKNGLLFNPKDPKHIARAVNQLASDPRALSKMKKNSLNASKTYNWENQAKKISKLYREITNEQMANH